MKFDPELAKQICRDMSAAKLGRDIVSMELKIRDLLYRAEQCPTLIQRW